MKPAFNLNISSGIWAELAHRRTRTVLVVLLLAALAVSLLVTRFTGVDSLLSLGG